jgi:hypothetical protein
LIDPGAASGVLFQEIDMSRPFRWVILLAAVASMNGLAGEDKGVKKGPAKNGGTSGILKKEAPKNNEVEVRFGDGSAVRMVMLQDSIDVETKYGKLTVPITEIRRIELGIHLPEGVDKKIERAIKALASDVFKERDNAVKELIALGPHAFPAVTFAAKSTDLEVAKRAESALKGIRQKYKADDLRTTVNDHVQTTDFPIVGRIVTPKIRAKTAYFGDLDLKLAELRTIHWLTGLIDLELQVEGSKYANRFNNQWMDTNVTMDGNGGLLITATGQIDLLNDGTGQGMSGPGGTRNLGNVPNRFGGGVQFPGTLIGKIGESGQPFTIGERFSTPAAKEGKLYLQVIPGPNWGGAQQASGAYVVKIKAGHNVK